MNKKHTLESVKSYFKDQGCELLEEEYKNNHYPMKYICHCGNLSKISLANFKKGKRCAKCGGTEKHTYKYVKEYFENCGCKLLETEYKNNSTNMSYKCECGNISKISFASLRKGTRCEKCGTKRTSKKTS